MTETELLSDIPEEKRRELEELDDFLDGKEREAGEQAKYAFKPFKKLLEEQTRVYEIPVPELEMNIRYGKLTVLDWMEVQGIEDDEEARRHSLYLMWRHGDPTVDREQILQLPFDVIEVVYNRMMENTPFLHLRWLTPSPGPTPPPGESGPSSPSSPDTGSET